MVVEDPCGVVVGGQSSLDVVLFLFGYVRVGGQHHCSSVKGADNRSFVLEGVV